MTKAHLIIDGELPTLNDYTKDNRTVEHSRNGKSFYKGNATKQKAQAKIREAITKQLSGVSFPGTVHLDFRWYEQTRKRDLDNICFAKKFILDELVNQKIIISDGWRGVVGFKDYFIHDKDNPHILVTIYRVGG